MKGFFSINTIEPFLLDLKFILLQGLYIRVMTQFKVYLNEITGTVAYWISPRGEVLPVSTNHIDVVIKNPKKFGLTTDVIEKTYEKYNERMGQEGKAREEIIINLLNKGFIRIRRYKNQYSLNIGKMTKKIKDILFDWADKLLNTGINGMRERDKYMPIKILGFGDNFQKTLTIQDVANDKLYEGDESFDISNAVVIVESSEDFMYEQKLLDNL